MLLPVPVYPKIRLQSTGLTNSRQIRFEHMYVDVGGRTDSSVIGNGKDGPCGFWRAGARALWRVHEVGMFRGQVFE